MEKQLYTPKHTKTSTPAERWAAVSETISILLSNQKVLKNHLEDLERQYKVLEDKLMETWKIKKETLNKEADLEKKLNALSETVSSWDADMALVMNWLADLDLNCENATDLGETDGATPLVIGQPPKVRGL